MSLCIICRETDAYFNKYNSSGLYNPQVTELHSNDAGYTHLTSGLSRSLKKLIGGFFQLNRVQYLSKGLNLLVILRNIHKGYNQQNATHPCAYGVAVRGFGDLLYIQLSFSVYLTCKWKGAVSYDTLPGTGFTGSGTIFSLVTTAGKFNRERLFRSLYEVSSNFTADMLFCFVSPSLCKFYNSGSTQQIWFSLPDSSLEHSNSWPTQHSCQESWVKWIFSYWFYLQIKVSKSTSQS